MGHDELRLDDLRHAAATLAVWTGATERKLMARLGHVNPAADAAYEHAARDRNRAIAAGLDVILQDLQKRDAR